ncbi:glycine cleavage system H protein [Rubritalea squalenifaciens DSM 18772]|uniref:Glycine cleavage system H protein n=2 Tax=Rubritalea TaxID=361050 RepID=A0A1M6GS52_9BACT|nr:glycine cleavage system protein GcvH [Rubritalea squalenifaciens]SHJ12739.1 glycine cleavage system H protein [Rubritalea squalenifaciens DSM 18772]
MSVPENLRYTADHEWVLLEGDVATVGITDHAQEELTDIVFVELPEIGRECEEEEGVAVVESVKAASDIYAPLAGEIVGANEALEADPALVNTDPHGEGWIFKIKLSDPSQVEGLMDAAAYTAHIGG